ncbi:hypothetical protein BGX34_004986 [Mortierella sp. NVP85]|nr:hypothetical protein BGX34_004986 [Mortierella sp. NVP85]
MSAEANTDSEVTPVAVPPGASGAGAEPSSSSSSATTTPAQAIDLKRELMNQKIRNENRERKKRWREQNEDRNKDNDLRCRVNKRALKLFGKGDSEHKARWIEEEFTKRQTKRKEKERKRNPSLHPDLNIQSASSPGDMETEVSLTEQLALHASAIAAAAAAAAAAAGAVTDPDSHHQQQQLQATAASLTSVAPQFDPTTVKTALALNDLVKKNGSHLDLAQLTGVLSDPNLARLLELEANSAAAAAAAAAATTQPPPLLMLNTTPKPDADVSKGNHMLDSDYPMDAVLTLMQLNGSWKA